MEPKIPENVQNILSRLETAGFEAWCVGGAVRDSLLGLAPGDWDVTTSALPQEVLTLFAPHALPTGLKHGTVTVGGGRGVEVTTYRLDGEYTDHRRPDSVTFSTSLTEDLARRDFTVNAIAMDIRGNLSDPFHGREDLRAGILRAVGDPRKRFQEDALRIMRGLRFASRLGFAIEERTAGAMAQCAPLLREIAPERLLVEMTGLLTGAHAADVLIAWPQVLGVFLPEILPAVGFLQHTPYHIYDVWEHTARAVGAAPADPILRWTMLFHDLGKPGTFFTDENGVGHFYGHNKAGVPIADAIMDRLRFDHRSRELISTLVLHHDAPLELNPKFIRRRLSRFGEETVRLLVEVHRADTRAQAPVCQPRLQELDQWEAMLEEVLSQETCFSLKALAVRGGDLTALGLQGPAVGKMLNRLLEQVIDEKLPNEREALLRYVKEVIQ